MTTQLQEPTRVNEPQQVTGYAEMISKVAAEGKALVVCRDGAEVVAIVPMKFLELVEDALDSGASAGDVAKSRLGSPGDRESAAAIVV